MVAHVAGSNITLEDVDHRAGGKLQRLRDEEYQARHQALEEIIAERLVEKEAASRGLTTEALLKAEVDAKVPLPTPAEVKGIYEQNRASAGGRSLEQVAPLIERSLRQQRLAERAGQFRDELKARAAVKVSLEAPRTPLEIPADAPVLGPAGAPVTIVEYLDYQCPFCHRVQGVVDDAEFTDKILRGASPSDMPIEQPVKYDLIINLRTAKALGLSISETVLTRADEVIE